MRLNIFQIAFSSAKCYITLFIVSIKKLVTHACVPPAPAGSPLPFMERGEYRWFRRRKGLQKSSLLGWIFFAHSHIRTAVLPPSLLSYGWASSISSPSLLKRIHSSIVPDGEVVLGSHVEFRPYSLAGCVNIDHFVVFHDASIAVLVEIASRFISFGIGGAEILANMEP